MFPPRYGHREKKNIEMGTDTHVKGKVKKSQATRLISTGQLNPSRDLHLQPIKVVVFNLPSDRLAAVGNPILEEAWRLDAFSAYPFRT